MLIIDLIAIMLSRCHYNSFLLMLCLLLLLLIIIDSLMIAISLGTFWAHIPGFIEAKRMLTTQKT